MNDNLFIFLFLGTIVLGFIAFAIIDGGEDNIKKNAIPLIIIGFLIWGVRTWKKSQVEAREYKIQSLEAH